MAPKRAPANLAAGFGLQACEIIHDYPRTPEYERLASEEIRIITLEAPGVLSVQRVKLSERPEYYALSYCWGEAKDLQPVQINNHRRLLRGHVISMLDTLHRKYGKIQVWIDMICIKQNDLEEKDRQVRQMDTVYRSATAVHAWIGESNDSTRFAFDILLKFKDWNRQQPDSDSESDLFSEMESHRATRFLHHYAATTGLIPAPKTRHGVYQGDEIDWLRPLSSRPYWRRLWIVQELILAQFVWVHCGEQHIDLLDIHPFCFNNAVFGSKDPDAPASRFDDGSLDSMESNEGFFILQSIVRHQETSQRRDDWDRQLNLPRRITVGQAVDTFVQLQRCKDPKDKVYALRALVDKWGKIKVDYQQSTCSLYRDLCRCERLRHVWPESHTQLFREDWREPMRKAMGLSRVRVWSGEFTDWFKNLTH